MPPPKEEPAVWAEVTQTAAMARPGAAWVGAIVPAKAARAPLATPAKVGAAAGAALGAGSAAGAAVGAAVGAESAAGA